MWKFNGKTSKDRWLILIAAGAILLILAFPSGNKKMPTEILVETDDGTFGSTTSERTSDYEKQLEQRVKQILKNVEGVGRVDVMIVLKSSEEKVLHVNQNSSSASTDETDSNGGTRRISSEEKNESTILTGSGNQNAPIIEKELKPEIAGIVVSATGGGSPIVKSEISSAMEALFDVPQHKIKVLKRVE